MVENDFKHYCSLKSEAFERREYLSVDSDMRAGSLRGSIYCYPIHIRLNVNGIRLIVLAASINISTHKNSFPPDNCDYGQKSVEEILEMVVSRAENQILTELLHMYVIDKSGQGQ